MRKHRSQMKADEIKAVETHVRSMQPTLDITHATDRMNEKKVTPDEIAKAVRFGEVVEIHNEATELRVLMRLAFGRPKVAVCAVVSVESNKVVTTWKNAGADNHKTIDMSQYTWKANAVELINGVQA